MGKKSVIVPMKMSSQSFLDKSREVESAYTRSSQATANLQQ